MANEHDKKKVEIVENIMVVARTIMSTNPFTAPLAQFWGEMVNRREIERIELFEQSLKALVDRHSNEMDLIKKEIGDGKITDAELSKRINALEIAIERASREHDKCKIPLYANIGCQSIIIPEQVISYDEKVNAIEIFSELSLNDLNILKLFRSGITYQVCELKGFSLETLIPALAKLSARGIISETVPNARGILMRAGTDRWDDVWRHKYFVILSSGNNLLKMLE